MNKSYMVTPEKIVNAATENTPINKETLTLGTTCYEAGMIEVLKGIATIELDQLNYIPPSKQVEKHNKKAVEISRKLSGVLDEAANAILMELETAYSTVAAAEADDHFIEGFLRGYRYLKYIREFHKFSEE